MRRRPPLLALLAAAALSAAGACRGRATGPPSGGASPRRVGEGRRTGPLPRVPPGVKLVSFDAERDAAAAGGFLEPAWCVQLTAEVRDAGGRPARGVPVSFRVGRRTGQGLVLAAALSHELVLTGPRGQARTVLVSSDRPEHCRVYALCGRVTLGAEVRFTRRRPPAFTVGLAGAPAPAAARGASPEAELDARLARLVAALDAGALRAAGARREITAMGRGVIPPLLRAIYDQHRPPRQRRLAARALALVRDELVLDRLLGSLDDRRAAVRTGAETGLFERGAKRAGRGVRRVATAAGSFGRAAALRVLAAWGRREDLPLLASRALCDPDPLVRATAAWKLKAFLERADARAALAGALCDRRTFVRYTAAKACAMASAVAGGGRPISPARTLRDPDPRIRAAAARACRRAGELLPALSDRDVRVRRAAAESLGAVAFGPGAGGPGAQEKLRELTRDRDEHVAEAAFRALVRRGGEAEAGHMLAALGHRDAHLAGQALASLERVYSVELGRPRFGARPGEELYRAWVKWVRACRGLRPAGRLRRAAERKASRLRGEAALEMARLGSAPAGRLAAKMIASTDPQVRAPAAAALWLLGQGRGREVLLADLASRDWPSRYAACRAAGAVRAPAAARALVVLLADESAAIRAQAHRSLVRLAGRDLGFDPEAPPAERAAARARWGKWAGSLGTRTKRGTGRKAP